MPNGRNTTRRSRRWSTTSRPKRLRRRTRQRKARRFRAESRGPVAQVLAHHGRKLGFWPLMGPQVLAAVLTLGILVGLAFLGISERFYVYAEDVHVTGAFYTDPNAVVKTAGVEGYHVFYVDPKAVAERVETLPYVKTARVLVHLPARVDITIVERQPVLEWVTSSATTWVDVEGVLLPPQSYGAPPLRLVDPEGWAAWSPSAAEEGRFNTDVLKVLLAWQDALPELREVYYDSAFGLWATVPYRGKSVKVIWGDTLVLEPRLEALRRVWGEMEESGQVFSLVDVSAPDEPLVQP